MHNKKIRIENDISKIIQIIENEILIILATRFIVEIKQDKDTYDQINHVRLCKKSCTPSRIS